MKFSGYVDRDVGVILAKGKQEQGMSYKVDLTGLCTDGFSLKYHRFDHLAD